MLMCLWCLAKLTDSCPLKNMKKAWNSDTAATCANEHSFNQNFILPLAQTLCYDWPPEGELLSCSSPSSPTPTSLSISLSLFLASNQPSGSVWAGVCVCVCVCTCWGTLNVEQGWPAPSPYLKSLVPPPTHTHTSSTARPHTHSAPPPSSSLHPPRCPLHWQSHIIIFSGRHSACVRPYL